MIILYVNDNEWEDLLYGNYYDWWWDEEMRRFVINTNDQELLHDIVWYCVILCDIVWYCVILCDIVRVW
jgi:hypothetical protein